MPTVGHADTTIFHSNYAAVRYDGRILGRLTNFEFIIDKVSAYDHIIGSNGQPYGQPVKKTITYHGSFSKGEFKFTSSSDSKLFLHVVGNDHVEINEVFDEDNFSSNEGDQQNYIDNDSIDLEIIPYSNVSARDTGVAKNIKTSWTLYGVVINKKHVKLKNNSFVISDVTFIAKGFRNTKIS